MWWIRDNQSNRIAICVSLAVDYKQNLFLNGELFNSYEHPKQKTVVFQSKSSNDWNLYAFTVHCTAGCAHFMLAFCLFCFFINGIVVFKSTWPFFFQNKWCRNSFDEIPLCWSEYGICFDLNCSDGIWFTLGASTMDIVIICKTFVKIRSRCAQTKINWHWWSLEFPFTAVKWTLFIWTKKKEKKRKMQNSERRKN